MPIVQTNTPDMESQAKKRRGQRLVDQHGRPWFANIELKSGDPVGQIEPLFQAPLIPPQMFLRKSSDMNRPNDLEIQYARWIEDNASTRATRDAKGREVSRKMFNTEYDPTKPFSQTVLDMIGEEPDPIEPIIAASQGNRFVLGLSDRDVHGLAKFLIPKDRRAIGTDYSKYDFRDAPVSNRDEEWDLEEELPPGSGVDAEALEEELDPHALGGQRVPVRRASSTRVAKKATKKRKRTATKKTAGERDPVGTPS